MGLPISDSKPFPQQEPLDDEKIYDGKLNVYFGQKKKFQSEEIEDCICFQVILTDEFCKDESGVFMMDADDKMFNRSVFIGKFRPSTSEKSHFYKWHKKLFGETISKQLWEEKYDSGDFWIALVNEQPVRIMVSTPEYSDDKTRYYQTVEKLMGFKPNPYPNVKNNPPVRDIHNKEMVLPSEKASDVPF